MNEVIAPKKQKSSKRKLRGTWSVVPAPHSELPNGRELTAYVDYETWEASRWAWEFLRRNKEFQKACDSLPQEREDRILKLKKLIRNYGLTQFKHWKEEYGSGRDNQPIFDGVRIRANLKEDPMDLSDIPPLEKGQALILLEILPCLDDLELLQKRMTFAYKQLEERLRKYAEKNKLEKPVSRKPKINKPEDLIAHLRILDLRGQAKEDRLNPAERFKTVYPSEDKELDAHTKVQREKDRFKTARRLSSKDYLTLALI
ncbi:MAG: transcriptional regulator domain-containing protein [Achromobacter sp.]|uniref:transcriptional regulator domain-containing protein n=1 Tax=Achromobacter sp. TaxID=134375 RepID=UPI003D00A6F0